MFNQCSKWLYNLLANNWFCPDCSNYNSLAVRRNSRSKKQARDAFQKHQIPHAHGTVFLNPYKAVKFIRQYGFPVVIKPNVSGFSRGSYFPIDNYLDLCKAILLAKLYWPTTIIEKYLQAINYRVFVHDTKIVAVAHRYEPFVEGNGRDTIATLIDQENAKRRSMGLYPIMHPIAVNWRTKKYLNKQKLTLQSVIPKGKKVKLFHRVALAPGGVVKTIDPAVVTSKNKQLFVKIMKIFNARVFGIDVLMEKGIHIDWDQQKCIVLEVNSRPYIKLHQYPRFGPRPSLQKTIAKLDKIRMPDHDIF